MRQAEDSNWVLELADGAIAPLEQELHHRLTVELDERDALALESALLKAFINGMSAGAAQAAEVEMEQPPTRPQVWGAQSSGVPQPPPELPRVDPWAEKYGAGA